MRTIGMLVWATLDVPVALAELAIGRVESHRHRAARARLHRPAAASHPTAPQRSSSAAA